LQKRGRSSSISLTNKTLGKYDRSAGDRKVEEENLYEPVTECNREDCAKSQERVKNRPFKGKEYAKKRGRPKGKEWKVEVILTSALGKDQMREQYRKGIAETNLFFNRFTNRSGGKEDTKGDEVEHGQCTSEKYEKR